MASLETIIHEGRRLVFVKTNEKAMCPHPGCYDTKQQVYAHSKYFFFHITIQFTKMNYHLKLSKKRVNFGTCVHMTI